MFIDYTGEDNHHTIEMNYRLNCSERQQAKDILKNQYVSNYRNILMNETDLELKDNGNANVFKGTQVLDQIRKEALAMHQNYLDDLKIRMERQENENSDIHMHNLSLKPF